MSVGRKALKFASGSFLLIVLAGITAFACNDSRLTASQGRVASILVLESIDGALPGILSHDTARKIEILNDTTTLYTDGRYLRRVTARTTEQGVSRTETVEQSGRYTSTGTTITVTFEQSESMILERQGDRFRGILAGRVFTYVAR